mgnify:CR=1
PTKFSDETSAASTLLQDVPAVYPPHPHAQRHTAGAAVDLLMFGVLCPFRIPMPVITNEIQGLIMVGGKKKHRKTKK